MHRVLILDSDPETLIKLQRVLEDADIDATITWDCTEASQLVESVTYDLMLIGDHSPDVDAAAVLETLSLRGTCPAVLILRAINSQNEVEYLHKVGATGVIPKQDSIAVLEQVRNVLARKPARRPARFGLEGLWRAA
ncbi:MAG TPA: response regulator [Candidatus Sulfotelmatobacter sp.]|nr:response regulator [Candidatus Sulfotelmatobacter sp.]